MRKLLINFGTVSVLAIAGGIIYLQNNTFRWDKFTNLEFANWFGRYGSSIEANKACIKWKKKRFWIKYQDKYSDRINSFPSRRCDYDKPTRQILGWEKQGPSKDKVYSSSPPYEEVVKKRFRY